MDILLPRMSQEFLQIYWMSHMWKSFKQELGRMQIQMQEKINEERNWNPDFRRI